MHASMKTARLSKAAERNMYTKINYFDFILCVHAFALKPLGHNASVARIFAVVHHTLTHTQYLPRRQDNGKTRLTY